MAHMWPNAQELKEFKEHLDQFTKDLIAKGPEACREYLRELYRKSGFSEEEIASMEKKGEA